MTKYTAPYEDDDLYTWDEADEKVMELSPSTKLVYKIFKDQSRPLSKPDLIEETLLPQRTLEYALGRLDEEDLLEQRRRLDDPRSHEYQLKIDGFSEE